MIVALIWCWFRICPGDVHVVVEGDYWWGCVYIDTIRSSLSLTSRPWNTSTSSVNVNIYLCRFPHNQGNIATDGSPKSGQCPTLISNDFIGGTVHSRHLDSLEHCICTTTMTNIRPDRDSNLVHPGYRPLYVRAIGAGHHYEYML